MPEALAKARDTVKQGYAEFFRAYATAFVRWIDDEPEGHPELLERPIRELQSEPREPNPQRSSLHAALEKLTVLELGTGSDRDLEVAFVEWLSRR